jgi:site-specific recombinase XerD
VYPASDGEWLVSRAQPLRHPLAAVFQRAVDSFCAALSPGTTRHYRGTVRNFLTYLGVHHPKVKRLDQLNRDPHILGWMAHMRAKTPPLATASYINLLIALRSILNELAWTQQRVELARLILRLDLPRAPHTLPRPLTVEQDQLLQQEFRRRNDLGGNAFLLMRHTGMRIGECIDLSQNCLRSTAPDQWAIHVPLGKLQTERMVPVDGFVCELVQRLRFFRSLDPLPADKWLLARPKTKLALVRQFRDYLHQVCHALGLPTSIVPHQLRHTFATQMLRAGISFPVLMKLLGHADPEMTMRYIDVALTDLEREFHLARTKPSHLPPQPKTSPTPNTGLDGIRDALTAAQHVMEMFRRSLPGGDPLTRFNRLENRLSKILAQIRKLKIT